MSKIAARLTPDILEKIQIVGTNIRLARLRRDISLSLVCQRTGLSRQTVVDIEKGLPTVSIGAYAAVLHALQGLDTDLLLIAKDDKLGHVIQDLGLENRKRASKK
jgi:transcriptional regulator with XRE-family HTH domain